MAGCDCRWKRSKIQTLIFDKTAFPDPESAREWALSHGFGAEWVDEKRNTWRIRQFPPELVRPGRWATMELRPGVKATLGDKREDVPVKGGGDDARTGRLLLDRAALRGSLGGRREVMEAARVLREGGIGANPAVMWSYFTTSVYRSGDLPVIATREALQNSVDAIRSAVRSRRLRKGAGVFEVTWDADAQSLTWSDNGVGMDGDTIFSKFLVLGESGKRGEASSDLAAGGFGVAKAVILGASTSFRWELHSRDVLVKQAGADEPVVAYEADEPRQGTSLTIYDVDRTFLNRWDRARQQEVPLLERLAVLLAACDLTDIELKLNGRTIGPMFSRRKGSKVALRASWGEGTTATMKVHRRPPGDKQGAYYVRLGGLFQFKAPSQRSNLKGDVVLDMTTTVRPGAKGYPLTASRDDFQGDAYYAWRDLVDEVERENETIGDPEDEVFDPEDGGAEGVELADVTQLAAEHDDVREALGAALGHISAFYGERAKDPGVPTSIASLAPAGSKVHTDGSGDGPERDWVLPPGMAGTANMPDEPADAEHPTAVANQIMGYLDGADRSVALGRGVSNPRLAEGGILTAAVQQAIEKVAQGQELDQAEADTVATAIDQAAEAAIEPTGGGLLQAAMSATVHAALDRVSAPRPKPKRRNPFGKFAGLRISRTKYDRRRARRFIKAYAKWVPHLTAWDATLRLVASEAGIRRRFRPGFVLNDDVLASVNATSGKVPVVYVHPDAFAQVIRAHRTRPIAVAGYLHALAAHELTHLDGRMGDGHDEQFVAAREDLGAATAHLLPAIAAICTALLALKPPEDEDTKELRRVTRLLENARTRAKRYRKDLRATMAERDRLATELQFEGPGSGSRIGSGWDTSSWATVDVFDQERGVWLLERHRWAPVPTDDLAVAQAIERVIEGNEDTDGTLVQALRVRVGGTVVYSWRYGEAWKHGDLDSDPAQEAKCTTTPGTRVTWCSLREWLDGYTTINRRKISSTRFSQEEAHLQALGENLDDLVDVAEQEDLEDLRGLARSLQPPKGKRQGHVTTKALDAVDRILAQRMAHCDEDGMPACPAAVSRAKAIVAELGVDKAWRVKPGHHPKPPEGFAHRDVVVCSIAYDSLQKAERLDGYKQQASAIAEQLRTSGFRHVEARDQLHSARVTAWPPAPIDPEKALEAISAALRRARPKGVDRIYLDSFLARNHAVLLEIVQQTLSTGQD